MPLHFRKLARYRELHDDGMRFEIIMEVLWLIQTLAIMAFSGAPAEQGNLPGKMFMVVCKSQENFEVIRKYRIGVSKIMFCRTPFVF